ncbi:MAG: hypothetical protein ISS19_06355 [Bacteroidales bacterium]|nr:hypothetical protein [Bacteroidales bacterium]
MKKTILLSVFSAALLLMSISCSKDEVPELTERNVPQAIIQGKVWADLNVTLPGYENAPTGTQIMAQVWTGDLMPIEDEAFVHTYQSYEANVDGSGNYSVSVDATTEGLNVRFIMDDFEYNQVQGTNPADSSQIPPKRKIYSAFDLSVGVVAGKTTIKDIYYDTF